MILEQWLKKIQNLHPINMDLSLERVFQVAQRLNVLTVNCPVITIAGTNGKGSCVSGLENIYHQAGYRVGAFTSPILFKHNEYIRIAKKEVTDEEFCEAFAAIDIAREDISLTPFEFNALAAFFIFQRNNLDVWILEVGLGGRFDAVNVIDADVAMVTSIDLDHMEWLGNTREKIAYEKAGIFRAQQFAVCGDDNPPASLLNYAASLRTQLFCRNKEFGFHFFKNSWEWWSQSKNLTNLPLPQLAVTNMASVLMTVELLQNKLPITKPILHRALTTMNLPGRIQIIPGAITRIYDVAHNPAAIKWLSDWLQNHDGKGKTFAVFSMLKDKDILQSIATIKKCIDEWHIAPLQTERAASLATLINYFENNSITEFASYTSIKEAYQKVMQQAETNDRVVIFGSFHTVAESYC